MLRERPEYAVNMRYTANTQRPMPVAPVSMPPSHATSDEHHLAVLDGWRGMSILCVLAAHLLPLGPSRFRLNSSVATLGMVMFFTLSGFLITSTLMARPNVVDFLIRRFCRIVPLAWLYLIFALPLARVPWSHYLPLFFFFNNFPHFFFDPIDATFWSLCVEMQFYLFVALLAAIFPRRWTVFVPLAALAVTLARVLTRTDISILTWLRVDEILAGGILAILVARRGRSEPTRKVTEQTEPDPVPTITMAGGQAARAMVFVAAMALLFVACQPGSGWIAYLRPYLSAGMIGITVFDPQRGLYALLRTRLLRFVASISYSLYVLHSTMMVGWFDPASKILKYERRALGFPALFLFAWVSTHFWETHWIAFGKAVIRRRHGRAS